MEDDEKFDLETESVITNYIDQQAHIVRHRLSPGNILRPIARTLGRLGAHLGIALSTLLVEVATSYDAYLQAGIELERRKGRKPPRRAVRKKATEPAPSVAVKAPYYEIVVDGAVAVKLADAGLIVPCEEGHFHTTTPNHASPKDHAKMLEKIECFIAGLRN